MKVIERTGERGNTIRLMIPETDADVEELRKDKAEADFDDRESFADDPKAWEEQPT